MSYVLNCQTKMQEVFTYKHKKFDRRKRSGDESTTSSSQGFTSMDGDVTRNNDTPVSVTCSDTNSSCDYQSLKSNNDLSAVTSSSPAPPFKRRRLITDGNDSGIYLTPQKVASDNITATVSPACLTPKMETATFPRFTSTPIRGTPPPPPPQPVVPLIPMSPTAAILPRISNATLQSICKYHGNMVRKFPKIERTPKDQERRDKNTLACRMSRRVKKLEHIAVEEQYKEFNAQHTEIVEATMRAAAYLNELMLRLANASNAVGSSNNCQENIVVPLEDEKPKVLPNMQPKPFSIEYLTRNESNS